MTSTVSQLSSAACRGPYDVVGGCEFLLIPLGPVVFFLWQEVKNYRVSCDRDG